MKHYTLVYQAGIANVFRHEGLIRERIAQSDFRTCETFCRGLREMGAKVQVAWCNRAGDVSLFAKEWRYTEFDDAPFSENFSNDFAPTFEPRS